MLAVHQLTYQYPKSSTSVLDHVSFTVQQGEFVSLIGASGSGKSTIFRLIAGLAEPNAGSIQIGGVQEKNRLGKVALMPQKDLLLPWRTVLDNILLPAEIAARPRDEVVQQAQEWIVRAGLSGYADAYPSQLSGGMRQRVSFLRTIMTGADVLLLDEPFGALDTLTRQDMQAWLLSIWEQLGKTVLFITHDIEEAVLVSDRVLVLRPGENCVEVPIQLSRPRTKDLVFTPELAVYRQQLTHMISGREGK